eukprot:GHVU01119538.1.p2 GENE.GHVU01119538.1~~GHVU01119538.1.p2  ORF type:complete len:206 (-),score=42.25 GHVU01119538.1:13-630(-)
MTCCASMTCCEQDPHTAENIINKVKPVLAQFGIGELVKDADGNTVRDTVEDSVHAVVTDNAPNMTAAYEHVEGKTCKGHSVQLVVKDASKDQQAGVTIAKVKKVSAHLSRSNVGNNKYRKLQREANVKCKKVKKNSKTRWGATYKQVRDFATNEVPLRQYLDDPPSNCVPEEDGSTVVEHRLDSDDWNMVHALNVVLEQQNENKV